MRKEILLEEDRNFSRNAVFANNSRDGITDDQLSRISHGTDRVPLFAQNRETSNEVSISCPGSFRQLKREFAIFIIFLAIVIEMSAAIFHDHDCSLNF